MTDPNTPAPGSLVEAMRQRGAIRPDPTVPVPGPDTPTWTIDDDGDLVYDPKARPDGDYDSYICRGADPVGVCITLAGHAALVADIRAARAHEHCGPAGDTLQQALELATEFRASTRAGRANNQAITALLDLLTDGDTDG